MEVTYRIADSKDIKLIFDWANDSLVRQNAFNHSVISWDNHSVWFQHKLSSNKSIIFIFYHQNIPLGQLRLDIEGDNIATIDYSVDQAHRGKGLGAFFLCEINKMYRPSNLVLRGIVKQSNIASSKAFMKANFKVSDEVIINNHPCLIFVNK